MRSAAAIEPEVKGSTERQKIPPEQQNPANHAEAGLVADLRAFLLPEKKWHYAFHLVVILTALSYWIASGLTLPEASWEEIVMYRPYGDNQVYPVITALSRLNFGDPTDAVNYGKGVAGFHAVILFPHAMLYAVFGWAGYMLADAGFSWLYLGGVVLLLRRCNVGPVASLVLGAAMATGSLQALSNSFNTALLKIVAIGGGETSEWGFPSLLSLQLFSKRIPRPMITESLMVFLLYGAVGLWREPRLPSLKAGVALGAGMSLLMQGDPYSFSVLGLVFLAVVVRIVARNQWRWPWQFLGGAAGSTLVVSSYFIYQMMCQEPDGAVRFGLYAFGRGRLMFLPGYGPLLRVGIVAVIAWLMIRATGGILLEREPTASASPAHTRVKTGGRTGKRESVEEDKKTSGSQTGALRMKGVGQFCWVLVLAAWLAQPVQVFLLGKGAQLYHYLNATLPTFYSYALVLLGSQVCVLTGAWSYDRGRLSGVSAVPKSWLVLGLGAVLGVELLLGIEGPMDAAHSQGTARDETNPWSEVGEKYRPSFRAMDKAFRENPKLKEAETFATFSHEVNFLLAAFHNKRAYLPDNGFTTLTDKELEERLMEVSKICMLNTGQFGKLIQNAQVLNYWLGCAKYWFALGQTYAPPSEYPEAERARLEKLGRQPVFSLVLPENERVRLMNEYAARVRRPSRVASYPDVVVMPTLLMAQGMKPNPYLYAPAYTNEIFRVYAKKVKTGVYAAEPNPKKAK